LGGSTQVEEALGHASETADLSVRDMIPVNTRQNEILIYICRARIKELASFAARQTAMAK
jgi:hypothetical protein